MLNFVIDTSALQAQADVVSREITVFVGGDSVGTTVTFATGDQEVGSFSGEQDSELQTSTLNIDDAGNRSEPRIQTFVLRDTIAPEQPGDVGIRVTSEV